MSQLNVDPQEIAKFEAFAAIWWDQHSEFRPLHQINPLRLNWIDEHSGGIAGKKVLDVGCVAPLNVARIHAEQEGVTNIEYRQVPVEELAQQQAGQYDVVTCMEMLEHVPDPASIIQACQTLVKPGGHVFFSTINRNPKSYLFAIIGAEYVLRMLAKGTHDYHKFIKPSELAHDIRNAGLTLKDMTGLHFNPLTKRYWLAPNVDVNYMVYTVKAGAE